MQALLGRPQIAGGRSVSGPQFGRTHNVWRRVFYIASSDSHHGHNHRPVLHFGLHNR